MNSKRKKQEFKPFPTLSEKEGISCAYTLRIWVATICELEYYSILMYTMFYLKKKNPLL